VVENVVNRESWKSGHHVIPVQELKVCFALIRQGCLAAVMGFYVVLVVVKQHARAARPMLITLSSWTCDELGSTAR
jgi:hypothetical protein